MNHLKISLYTIDLLSFRRNLATLANDFAVQLLQPVELCDPFRDSQATDCLDADGLIKPVFRSAALEEEVPGDPPPPAIRQ